MPSSALCQVSSVATCQFFKHGLRGEHDVEPGSRKQHSGDAERIARYQPGRRCSDGHVEALDFCCIIFTREDTTGDSLQAEFIYRGVGADFNPDWRRAGALASTGRDPDFTSVGFVLWMPAFAGMTNRSKAADLSSSKGATRRGNLPGPTIQAAFNRCW